MFLLFGLILSVDRFSFLQILPGLLYLLRLFVYFHLFFAAVHAFSSNKEKNLLRKCLIVVVFLMSVFGWIQLFIFPDLNYLTVFGWDRHLYRITSTLLDPNYLGILLVFAIIMVIKSKSDDFQIGKNIIVNELHLLFFFSTTLAFTFSRSSYLALFCVIIILLFQKRFKYIRVSTFKELFDTYLCSYFLASKKLAIIIISTIFCLIFLWLTLPLLRLKSEGTYLLRTKSIENRIDYFNKTLPIFLNHPLFGVGYNNLCAEKIYILGYDEHQGKSHACSGADTSILVLLSTTGISGLILFMYFIKSINKNLNVKYSDESKGIIVALVTHSFFVNSAFYAWIMIFILLYVSTLTESKKFLK